jgi:hypothetical protein
MYRDDMTAYVAMWHSMQAAAMTFYAALSVLFLLNNQRADKPLDSVCVLGSHLQVAASAHGAAR